MGATAVRSDIAACIADRAEALARADEWEWGAGVALYGMLRHDPDDHHDTRARVRDTLLALLGDAAEPPIAKNGVNTLLPGLCALLVTDAAPNERLDTAWRRLAHYARHEATYTDGMLDHANHVGPHAGQRWVDTTFISLPFFLHVSRRLGDPWWHASAVAQLFGHVEALRFPGEALCAHAWEAGRHLGVRWARGNAWAIAACAEFLHILPPDDPARERVIALLAGFVPPLLALQDASGMWHTVLDDPTTYLEASGTAGIAHGLFAAAAHGVGGDANTTRAAAARARAAVLARVAADGTVGNVSAGTPVYPTAAGYDAVPVRPETWGQGLALLMLAWA